MDRIGLIAGNGKLPKMFIEQCIRQGIEPVSVYLFDSVEESVKKHVNSAKYSIAQPGKIISYFKKNNISRLVMLGKVEKRLIFENLILDEPFNGIDLITRDEIAKTIIQSLRQDNVIIISSHLIEEMESFIDSAIFIRDGHLLEVCDTESLRLRANKSLSDRYRELMQ